MHTICIAIQVIGIIVLFAETIYLVNKRPSRQQIRLLLLMIALLVEFVGYLFEIQAHTMQQALQALKFAYMGRTVSVLTMFLFVMEYCRVRFPKWLPIVLACLHVGEGQRDAYLA